MCLAAPETAFADAALRKKAVDMGIPFQIPAKGMKDKDKSGSEAFCFVVFAKHIEDDTSDSRKEAGKNRTVLQEIGTQFFGNGKDTVSVFYMDDFERHGGGAVNGIFVATGRAETAFTAERDKFKVSAFCTTIHGAAIGRVATVRHAVNIFHDRMAGM